MPRAWCDYCDNSPADCCCGNDWEDLEDEDWDEDDDDDDDE